jgi:glucan phosphoethanolaminetransferase (alkaline phosphatase superfamily)
MSAHAQDPDGPTAGLVAQRGAIGIRWGLWAVAFAPALASVAVDVAHRGARIGRFSAEHLAYYGLSVLQAGLVWGLLLQATGARNRGARVVSSTLFVIAFTLALGSQTYFFTQYQSYINRDLSLFAVDFWDSVVNQAGIDLSGLVGANLPFLLLSLGLALLAPRAMRQRPLVGRHVGWLAPLVLVAACVVPLQDKRWQAATPDMLYLNALGGFVSGTIGVGSASKKPPPRLRESLPVPKLTVTPSRARNVLLIITESVRADAACSAYDKDCALTPYTNALLPNRVGLSQLRSLDSTTATSLAVLWSGLSPTESADTLHTWPLLFDYAKAAGFDTAYWTSQNLNFGRTRLWVQNLGARLTVSGSDLDRDADLDLGADESLLASHVETQLGHLDEPFFAVIQLSNTHHPYYVNLALPQPFQPASRSAGPREVKRFRNYYQNSVVQQDQHVASILSRLRSLDAGTRTVVLYTSDHGEAFREHHQTGHTFTVYDEEVHVPGFVDAPPGTLDDRERRLLSERSNDFVFHHDVTPTILDLMGVWEHSELAPFKAKFQGQSWLRQRTPRRAVPMTNCSALWQCAFENWGVMQGSLKVLARTPYDLGWRCFDLTNDPGERSSLRTAECLDLEREALTIFGRLPR